MKKEHNSDGHQREVRVTVELTLISMAAAYMHLQLVLQSAWNTILVPSGETVAPPGDLSPKSPVFNNGLAARTYGPFSDVE